jgi:hypothetical protein
VTGTVGPMRRCVAGVVAVLVGAGLAACSSDTDTGSSAASGQESGSSSDVCASAESFRTSLTGLREVDVVQEGTGALEAAWATVQDDWAKLADDARGQYADEVDGVQSAADGVQSAVDAAQDDASAQSLGNAATAVGVFLQDASAFADKVSSTC